MHEVQLPQKHPLDDLTTEQLAMIGEDAKMMMVKFRGLPEAED